MNMEQTKVELLSPAGNYECFLAAVSAGADAVYLGLDRFGARAGAHNLSIAELKDALNIAHPAGRKIYLTVNTLLKDDETDQLYDFLYEPYIYGIDGVIVQDVGVMSYISRVYPDLPIHVSTQAAVTSSAGARYLQSLGIKRIVPARELSLREIRKMVSETGLEVECFIHGSMCYSYSGKCLLSSYIGGRSGNRGRCAQPCRLMYEDRYPLSLKDMCTVDILPDLIDAGITSFKIEGRMKGSGYVYSVTSLYRKYIDMYYETGRCDISDRDRRALTSAYSRSGNCEGYYRRHNGADMITPESPSYTSDEDNDYGRMLPVTDVNIECILYRGSNARIRVYNDKAEAEAEVPVIAEQAVNCALTDDDIIKQMTRSGGTPFNVRDVSIIRDDDIFIPKSGLNAIRRQGLDAFMNACLAGYIRKAPRKRDIHSPKHLPASGGMGNIPVNVSVLDREQFDAALSSSADGIIIPMHIFEYCMNDTAVPAGTAIYAELPYVIRDEGLANSPDSLEKFARDAIMRYGVDGFYVSNNESVRLLRDIGYEGAVVAGIFMYAYNNEAYDYYIRSGITKTTVPSELNERELQRRGITGEELIVYGRVPVMVSANCVYNTLASCSREGHKMYITDRKRERLFADCICSECTNVLYNSVPSFAADEERLFACIRPSSLRFCFTDEKGDEVTRILDTYYKHRRNDGTISVHLTGKYTRGHLKRGVE